MRWRVIVSATETDERRAGSRAPWSDEAFSGTAQLPRPRRRISESGRWRRPPRAARPHHRTGRGIGLRQDDGGLTRPEAPRADDGADSGGWHGYRRAVTQHAENVQTDRPDGLPGSPWLSRSTTDR